MIHDCARDGDALLLTPRKGAGFMVLQLWVVVQFEKTISLKRSADSNPAIAEVGSP
jgi:hypothetical protein